MAGVINYR